MSRIDGEDLAGDEPVEQHLDGGEVLLDGRLLVVFAEDFDVGADMDGFDIGKVAEAGIFAPSEEFEASTLIGFAGIIVFNGA